MTIFLTVKLMAFEKPATGQTEGRPRMAYCRGSPFIRYAQHGLVRGE